MQFDYKKKGRYDVHTRGGEREKASDCGCDYKTRIGTTYFLEAERGGDASDNGYDPKTRAGMTYSLEVERGRHVRSRLPQQNEGRHDIPAGSGKGGRVARQITIATTK